ncbi:MAG: ATP-dependent DNA helicase RecG [Bacteroidota bacterium]|nr:ATP-dependent DNA helicase RecG [Bacteroidota bacterium]MDX5429265.1 ATP-dependent DNA helicase RecG [Bacteroidota bacterium]MDX5448059.1 ATP-dependent DNA helicase RecG [Bacteroidota bacterium]MDX5506888.1 ATP-dependent DNA helicase RecG [Bacteroidota bacterium]
MEKNLLETPIEYLKGVGPQRAELLKKEIGIFTFGQLLEYYPFRYVDRTRFYKIREIQSDSTEVQIKGQLIKLEEIGKSRQKRLVAQFADDTGMVELIWFQGIRWVKQGLKAGVDYIVFGKPSFFKGKLSFAHPELEKVADSSTSSDLVGLQPIYSSTEKLSSKGLHAKGIARLMKNLLEQVGNVIPENLSPALLDKLRLMPKAQAMEQVHFPRSPQLAEAARNRLKFEEFFFIQLGLLHQKNLHKARFKGYVFEKVGDHFNQFFHRHLPFELTGAQKRVLKEIRKDLRAGVHMNRLVQGDVGSGKTIVALMSMLLALDNGFQSCLMAPTEILATQHFNSLVELLERMNINVALLTGSTKPAARKKIHQMLEDGTLHLIVGTHALIEEKVKFKNLGLAVIDEQHRFGVAQRAALWKKNTLPPHILVMTATPIPRTLAMSLYGDLDISLIDELPPGRKPIRTEHRFDSHRLRIFDFMKKEIAKGRQIYVVYPLIEESETLDYKDLMDGYESICREFPKPHFQVSIVHGKMKAEDKDLEMERFASGKTQIMVATTVIEVGVNVPNASVMVIESAERFGLSQLHQLRGRVGRGAEQSYCILMTGHKLSNDAKTRMETMVRTNDGFEIADVDLRLRGPGDLMGTRQSGALDLRIADLSKDAPILNLARQYAEYILKNDPNLESSENQNIRKGFLARSRGKTQWSRIS